MARTNQGADWQASLMGNAAGVPAQYIGVTADATTPDPTRTALPGEISSGTLSRVAASYGHTSGTTSYTLSHTFTSDQTVVLAKVGIFTTSSGNTLMFESLLNQTASLFSGDQMLVTETINI